MTDQHFNRREALQISAALGAGLWLGTSTQSTRAAANEKLNVAVIGIGGRGVANLNAVAKTDNIVALCDIDDKRAGNAYERFPKAKKYTDFRRMLDSMENQIDAVVVSTPDHTHFHPSMMAMTMGKHLYCEKPMAHSVWEVREMTKLAAKKNLATQLGMQRHALANMHRVVELIKSGAIGDVTEVHSWIASNRGMPAQPVKTVPPPKTLDWDLWIGPAKFRPYALNAKGDGALAPYNWRFWWDYGTGETGNFGCHILDIPYWALDLKYPTRVDASGPEIDAERTPTDMHTHFAFPANDKRPGLKLHWYQSKKGPAVLKEKGVKLKGANTLFIGSKGMLLTGFGSHKLFPEKTYEGFKAPEQTIPDSPGFHKEWTDACKGGTTATCNFDYSGPLTETVLLGNTAYRAGGGFDWDAASLTATGNDKAKPFLYSKFRKGWEDFLS
ncbi:MAG: Gfo/Idh/MocA family oxidoreductase [Planctomycetes bacterium]|nr:Gfo/Idh/MocA family oxidoreductase [Planctomycetota bacterium]MCH9725406.1 Gfo/Idh/MocA family oxidoreductase [Planctomycetota bacterium]MCH9776503.1 Gfo/Idh/MocA family oxidoreductase [Planctomycetota bacterium]MCH9790456.1 Gfo/Idh/MocA family oxidoreductase [Planctomycetota bacterium]